MTQPHEDVVWVARFIRTTLRWSIKPVTRDKLTVMILEQQHLAGVGRPWCSSTAGRRVRDAIRLLLEGDSPVISVGGGFKLAARATAAERERAAVICERRGEKEFVKARKIRAVALPGEPVERRLFPRIMA